MISPLAQIPQPPVPPAPPDPSVFVQTWGPSAWEALAAIIAVVVGAVLLWPLVRGLARRLEGRGADSALRGEVDQLHDRLAELEHLEARVAELENRVEFSERLLTRQRGEAARIPPGEGGR